MASASPSDEVVIKSPAIAPFEFMTASRVVFGCGTSKKVPSLVKDLVTLEGCADKPALIVTGKSDRFSAPLVESLKAEGIDAVVYHCPGGEPTTATAEAAIALASSNNCGSVIAIGGGTPVDTGKCVAAVLTNGGPSPDLYDFLEVVGRAQPLTTRCAPFVAVPTTAGPGAEVTKNSVLEAGDRKVSMRHQFMLPELVVVDPELTLSMPRDVTAHTGLDALTQCIEPYVCNATNPLTDAISLAGIAAGSRSLRAACDNPTDINASIDIRTPNAAEFIDALIGCRLISSASLHGIILAEAYNIPWTWVQLNSKTEKAFKFHDFFLSVGILLAGAKPLIVTANTTIQELASHTLIPKPRGPSLYDPVKLLNACPFCNADIVAKITSTIESQSNNSHKSLTNDGS